MVAEFLAGVRRRDGGAHRNVNGDITNTGSFRIDNGAVLNGAIEGSNHGYSVSSNS